MDLSTITVNNFRAHFVRDFDYAPVGASYDKNSASYVYDGDITKAFSEAQMLFNQELFGSDADIQLAYLYLTAHYLVIDLRSAQQGINGVGDFPVTSRSVGSVSEAYSIPQRFLDDPNLAFYTKTNYGVKYLSFVLPKLIGNVFTVEGNTVP
jgi:hypothetical protein